MKKLTVVAASVALSGVLLVQPVGAQEGPSGPDAFVRLTTPASGSKVGNRFEVRGTIEGVNQNGEKCIPSRLYITTQDGYNGDGKSGFGPEPQINGSIISYQVDLTQALINYDGSPNNAKAQPGEILLQVSATNCSWGNPEGQILVDYVPSQQAPVVNAPAKTPTKIVSPAPSVAPTPSPSVSPVMATPDPKGSSEFPDWAYIALGALAGAALLGGAEYSAHQYHKKHPKKGKK